MIADDQKVVRAVLRFSVETHDGLTVCPQEAETGRQAVEVVRRRGPDGVILDWEMPQMDGLEALPEIRRALPAGVIVMYSSQDSNGSAAAAIDAGADAYFQKGVHAPEEVVAAMAEMLAERRSR